MRKHADSIAERRLAKFLKIICIMPMIIFPPMIMLNHFKGAYILAGVEIAMLAIFGILLFFISKPDFLIARSRFLNIAAVIIISTVVVLHVAALFLPTHHTIFSHSALVIMMVFLILGKRRGLPIAILITVTSLSTFIYKYSIGVNALPAGGQGNIFILILITFITSYFNESTSVEYEAALLEKNEELALLSEIDGLTQLFNRRYFDQNLDKEWSRLQRDNFHLSLIMCDIDHFKQFNDVAGHQAGDLCIQKVALSLKSINGRSSDVVARYGGEEFVILLPQTDAKSAKMIAQKVLENIAELAVPHPAYEDKPVSLSLGVSTIIPSRELNPSLIVSLADEALYESKRNGRNQISIKNYSVNNL